MAGATALEPPPSRGLFVPGLSLDFCRGAAANRVIVQRDARNKRLRVRRAMSVPLSGHIRGLPPEQPVVTVARTTHRAWRFAAVARKVLIACWHVLSREEPFKPSRPRRDLVPASSHCFLAA
jgi:hypothetical protein